ncbi:hypothetical protein TSUD_121340 [Trifolium subterraneum]|nr:hypothetical protein TSUD_121340 [Trifolium subterraneum]
MRFVFKWRTEKSLKSITRGKGIGEEYRRNGRKSLVLPFVHLVILINHGRSRVCCGGGLMRKIFCRVK